MVALLRGQFIKKEEIKPEVPAPEVELPKEMPEIKKEAPMPGAAQEKPSEAEKVMPAAPVAVSSISLPTDAVTTAVEKILEEDLEEIYFNMPPAIQQEFKLKGEETASKIRLLLQEAKARAGKILKLIVDWLKLIPGVNQFFLEQESKIKTDKILKIIKN